MQNGKLLKLLITIFKKSFAVIIVSLSLLSLSSSAAPNYAKQTKEQT